MCYFTVIPIRAEHKHGQIIGANRYSIYPNVDKTVHLVTSQLTPTAAITVGKENKFKKSLVKENSGRFQPATEQRFFRDTELG